MLYNVAHFTKWKKIFSGVVQNKSIACQADRSLLDGKKEKFSCPVFSCSKATFY
jgi:hypothetical protein